MTEAEFQIVKSIGSVLALSLALTLQRWSPHRALARSWRANSVAGNRELPRILDDEPPILPSSVASSLRAAAPWR
jgi:hypothetical protein